MMQVLPAELKAVFQRECAGCGQWRCRRRQIHFIVANHGEEMLSRRCVHQRMRPGENDARATRIALDQIEPHEFTSIYGEWVVKKPLAQAGFIAMDTNRRRSDLAPWEFPLWQNEAPGG